MKAYFRLLKSNTIVGTAAKKAGEVVTFDNARKACLTANNELIEQILGDIPSLSPHQIMGIKKLYRAVGK